MAKPVRRQRILVLVLIIGVVATRLTDGQAHASPVAASQGTAAIVNLNYEGDGPLHAPKIVNGINYQYDANGNLTNDGERIIEWNVENRVTSVKTVKPVTSVTEYVYDGDGRRIVKSVKNSKLVYVNNNLTIKQFNHETVPEYYYPLPPATAVKDENGLRYLHPDHLGSTRLITNSEGQTHAPGQTLSSINYFPYGEGVNESVSQRVNESRYLYTGQELDAETNLYNLNARLYSPTTAHFISADAAQGPNRYAYVSGNPLRYIDPSGNAFEHGDGGGGGREPTGVSDRDYLPPIPSDLRLFSPYFLGRRRASALVYLEKVYVAGLAHPGLADKAIERTKGVLRNVGVFVVDYPDPRSGGFSAFPEPGAVLASVMHVPLNPFWFPDPYNPMVVDIPIIFMAADFQGSSDYLSALAHESVHALKHSGYLAASDPALTLLGIMGVASLSDARIIDVELEAYGFEEGLYRQAVAVSPSLSNSYRDLQGNAYWAQKVLRQRRLGVVTPLDRLRLWLGAKIGPVIQEDILGR